MTAHGIERSIPVVDPLSGRLPRTALRAVDPAHHGDPGRGCVPAGAPPVLTRDGRAPVVRTDGEAGTAARGRTRGTPRSRCASGCSATPPCTRCPRTPTSRSSSPRRRTGTPARPGPPRTSSPGSTSPGCGWSTCPRSCRRRLAPADDSGERIAVYPRSDRQAQLPVANLLATERLASTGSTYGRMLLDNDTVAGHARADRDARLLAERPRRRRPGAQPGGQHQRLRARADAGRPDRGTVLRDDVQRAGTDPGHPGQRARPDGQGRRRRARPGAPA